MYLRRTLQKAILRDPVNKRSLYRAAERIGSELQSRLRKGGPISFDSAHLEQAFRHHLDRFGPEALLKMGMLLRSHGEGHISDSDIRLINMLPFYISNHTNSGAARRHLGLDSSRGVSLDPKILATIGETKLREAYDSAMANSVEEAKAAGQQVTPANHPLTKMRTVLDRFIKKNPKIGYFLPEIFEMVHNVYHGHGQSGFPFSLFKAGHYEYPEEMVEDKIKEFGKPHSEVTGFRGKKGALFKGVFGKYQQTSMKYQKGQSIMDWLARYVPTHEELKGVPRRYLYHGASRPYTFFDPLHIASSHNYGHGFYTSTKASVPFDFSQLHMRSEPNRPWENPNPLYPYFGDGMSFDDRYRGDKIINRLTLPRNIKIFHHDKNYSKTALPKQITKYFDELAERMNRPDLKGAFMETCKDLRRLGIGWRYHPFLNGFFRDNLSDKDDESDSSQHFITNPDGSKTMKHFYEKSIKRDDDFDFDTEDDEGHSEPSPPPSLLEDRKFEYHQNDNSNYKNELYGHLLNRAIVQTFIKFGAGSTSPEHNFKFTEHHNPELYFDGIRTPYRNAVSHATMLLSSLGYGGYRHLDPETHEFTTSDRHLTIANNHDGYSELLVHPSARSVVLYPSTMTDIPASEFSIAMSRAKPIRKVEMPGGKKIIWHSSEAPEQIPPAGGTSRKFIGDTPKRFPPTRGRRGRFETTTPFPGIPRSGPRPRIGFNRRGDMQ